MGYWDIGSIPCQTLGLSSTGIVFGRHLIIPGTFVPPRTSLVAGDEWVAKFLLGIQKHLQENRAQAQWFQPVPAGKQVHDTQSGDTVMIKVHSRKTKLDHKWESPYTVLLTSYFVVKVTGKENWIHHSHVK